jgi:hypothetical protein
MFQNGKKNPFLKVIRDFFDPRGEVESAAAAF